MTTAGLCLQLPAVALCLSILGGVLYLAYRAGVEALDTWVRGAAPVHDLRSSWECRCAPRVMAAGDCDHDIPRQRAA